MTLAILFSVTVLVGALSIGRKWVAWALAHGVVDPVGASLFMGLRWPVLLLGGGALVERLYHLLPDRVPPPRIISAGAFLAVLGWGAATWGFSHVAMRFFRLHVAYGSLGSVVVLLAWMFLGCLALMLGGTLNALLDRGLPPEEESQGQTNGIG